MLRGSSVHSWDDSVGIIRREGGVVALSLMLNESDELVANVLNELEGEEPVELAGLESMLLIVEDIWSGSHTSSSPADILLAKATSALLYLKNGEFDTSPVGVGGLGIVSFGGIENRAEK